MLHRLNPDDISKIPDSTQETAVGADQGSGSVQADATGPQPLIPQQGRVKVIYEDPSLYPAEEKRAVSDRVIAYLKATGNLTPGMLMRARRLWRATGRQENLWRILLRTGELPEETILEGAAVTFGFHPVEVSLLETVGLIDHLSASWPKSVMTRLLSLGILPVVPTDGSRRPGVVTFAAYDPTRAEVRRMVETVADGTHSIRYLSREGIDTVVKAVSDFLPGVLPASIKPLGAAPQIGGNGQEQDDSAPTRKAA